MKPAFVETSARLVSRELCRNGKADLIGQVRSPAFLTLRFGPLSAEAVAKAPRAGNYMTAATLERPRAQPTETATHAHPESPVKLNSIEDYFSIENEIDFVDKVKDVIPMEDTRRYIEEDMYKFLGEFAGKVPYTTIKYKKTLDGLDFAGLNLTDSYRRAATNGERERAEWVGYDKIQHGLTEGKKTAKWLSPAKISNYGFLFYFQQDEADPNWVTEYILRYDEKLGTTGESQKILDRLSPDQSYNTAEEFLNNPIVEDGFNDPKRELMYTLNAAGIKEEDIERSFIYETTVKQLLSKRVDEYTDAILTGDKEKATRLRNGIFAAAVEIAGNLEKQYKGEPGHVAQTSRFAESTVIINKFDNDATFFRNANQDIKIEGGGSCPAIRKNSKNPFLANDIRTSLESGVTPEKLAQSDWEYKEVGTCRVCEREYTEEQAKYNDALGPCHVCKGCEETLNKLDFTPDFLRETTAEDLDLAA